MSVELIFLFVVIVLFILAVSDLVVGVGNDAVNFLNSAIGSKTASFKVVMLVAIAGVLVGSTFSGGMMEIARNGMFYPEKFLFTEFMIICLAVMITDVILLDMFNAAGLPTSTTVSMVFELLGSAFAIAIFKTIGMGHDLSEVVQYINTAKALGIVSSILLSVIIAFTVGAIIQYLVRIVFTFQWEKTYRYFGSIWGGIAFAAITYFMVIKGAKGISFITSDMVDTIKSNTMLIIGISFIGSTILFQLLISIFKVNILKIIVLIGTFSLAMAFAGNDLVNFIGVPLAGYESYKVFITQPGTYGSLYMSSLNNAIKSPTFFLLTAGVIMSLTLWFSKKARTVIKTSVDLSRQTEGSERFSSNGISRAVVRGAIKTGKVIDFLMPEWLTDAIEKRFKKPKEKDKLKEKDRPAFDMVRASVILVVSSALIAMGTSLKLPLSTTYVTFMVAMGTSFSDRAWGRDSAVYRVSGVITVIGGWFFTAFAAFTGAFLIATALFFGSIYALIIIVSLAIFIVLRTHFLHTKKVKKEKEDIAEQNLLTPATQVEKCNKKVVRFADEIPSFIERAFICLAEDKRNKLSALQSEHKDLSKDIKHLRNKSMGVIHRLDDGYEQVSHHYIQLLDYMKELSESIGRILLYEWNYIDNNHPQIHVEQGKDLFVLSKKIDTLFRLISSAVSNRDFSTMQQIEKLSDEIIEEVDQVNLKQIKLMKKEEIGSRNTLLVTNILHEVKNISNHSLKLTKAARKFNAV